MGEKVNPAVETLLFAAVEIQNPREREEYLERACQGNQTLRKEVERFVADYFRAGAFLDLPNDAQQLTALHSVVDAVGERIGRYRLLEQIGEGGMGIVYLAEQTEPVRRKVALKIIKPGMDSRQVIARFEAERQALALMDHVHIARV